jgi:hypothetical protein
MADVPDGAAFYPKGCVLAQLLTPGAALRRAVAQFDGLLRPGRNRKYRYRKSRFDREDARGWTLPEEQL